MTKTTPENAESFSTRLSRRLPSMHNAECSNFVSKHCSEWWPNDRAPGALCMSFAASTISLYYFSICSLLAYSLHITFLCYYLVKMYATRVQSPCSLLAYPPCSSVCVTIEQRPCLHYIHSTDHYITISHPVAMLTTSVAAKSQKGSRNWCNPFPS